MLKLAEASAYFDRTEVLDPDNGNLLFYGQIDPFDDSKRDAGGAYRRILSVAPGTAMPANRAVRALGRVYLLGTEEVDGHQTEHRVKYVLQSAGSSALVHRLPGFVSGTPAGTAWSSIQWVKDGKEIGTSSDITHEYTIFLGLGTDVRAQDVITCDGKAYLVGSVRPQPSGFLTAEAVQLDYALSSASITGRVYDAVAGSYTPSAPVATSCIRTRWQNLFNQRREGAAPYKNGDDTLVFPAGTALNTSSLITLDGKPWQVVSVDTPGGAATVHARPAWAS